MKHSAGLGFQEGCVCQAIGRGPVPSSVSLGGWKPHKSLARAALALSHQLRLAVLLLSRLRCSSHGSGHAERVLSIPHANLLLVRLQRHFPDSLAAEVLDSNWVPLKSRVEVGPGCLSAALDALLLSRALGMLVLLQQHVRAQLLAEWESEMVPQAGPAAPCPLRDAGAVEISCGSGLVVPGSQF